MKKLLSLISGVAICLTLAFSTAHAQSGYLQAADGNVKTADTIANAGTAFLSIGISGYQNVVSIQPLVTKISGTTAGTLRLFGSLDGTNYTRINATTDSLVLTNVAGVQTKIFVVPNSPYSYYRVQVTGSGTQSTKVQAFAIWRKQ